LSGLHQIDLHLDTASLIANEEDDLSAKKESFDRYMRCHLSLLESDFEASADRARMAAPSREDLVEWQVLQEALRDENDLDEYGEVANSTPHKAIGYVHKFRFRLAGLRIKEFDGLGKEEDGAFSEANKQFDLLWLASDYETPPSVCMRVVAHRSLVAHFEYIGSTPIAGWSRPPQEN
jgi:hypothetical protein